MTDAPHDIAIYQAVAARRLQWDSLLWQVPTIAFVAQSLLLSVALASDSSQVARVAASAAAVAVSFLSLHLFARHRQAELADAHWLEDYERLNGLPMVHGQSFKERRDSEGEDFNRLSRRLIKWRAYGLWLYGLTLLLVASIIVLGLAVFCASSLATDTKQPRHRPTVHTWQGHPPGGRPQGDDGW